MHRTHPSTRVVVLRPTNETIDILRRTLMEVERDLDPVVDAASLSTLKRVVLNRIAELELEQARQAKIPALSVPAATMGNSPKPAEGLPGEAAAKKV